jgi:hypothetical protein
MAQAESTQPTEAPAKPAAASSTEKAATQEYLVSKPGDETGVVAVVATDAADAIAKAKELSV